MRADVVMTAAGTGVMKAGRGPTIRAEGEMYKRIWLCRTAKFTGAPRLKYARATQFSYETCTKKATFTSARCNAVFGIILCN